MEISPNNLEHFIAIVSFLTPMAYADLGIMFLVGLPQPCGYLFVFGWYIPFSVGITSPLNLIWWPDLVIYSTLAGSWLFLGFILVLIIRLVSKGEPYSFLIKAGLIIVFILQILILPALLQFIYSYVCIIPIPIPSTIAIIGLVHQYKKHNSISRWNEVEAGGV